MSKALEKALAAYKAKFGDEFPTFPYRTSGESDMIEIIRKCIKNNRDVYDSGFLELDDIEY